MSKESFRERIKVAVRVRPLPKGIDLHSESSAIRVEDNVVVSTSDEKRFQFDQCYDQFSQQKEIFLKSCTDIVDSVLQGYNGTIFAYGQTGSGKTFTMQGQLQHEGSLGVMPRCFRRIFETISSSKDRNVTYLIRASFVEIYNEELRDLLSDQRQNGAYVDKLELKDRDGAISVVGLSEVVVQSYDELTALLQKGQANRATGATAMNDVSSRSHAVFQVFVEQCQRSQNGGVANVKVGKLSLVDLAGSERQSKTQSTGIRFAEATKINLSLTALAHVMSSIVSGAPHIPYRDSKLTRLLQDALGGNSKTLMIATISPDQSSLSETLNTLRYAWRAKQIKNKPLVNDKPQNAMVLQVQNQIQQIQSDMDSSNEAELSALEQSQLDQLNEQLREIQSDISMNEIEKQRLIQAVEQKRDILTKERTQRLSMERELQNLQSKIVVGGKNLVEESRRLDDELLKEKANVQAAKREEEQAVLDLEQLLANGHQMKRTYASILDQIKDQEKQIQSLQKLIKTEQVELDEIMGNVQLEIEELEVEQKDLNKQCKLKLLILQYYLPKDLFSVIIRSLNI
ncbi:hypothetical protein MP228_007460 [Amoeboaphelidium protococcarum]|nr:hypothetical protein MP228_007460 [Amoeboaphelidium protococcarum]